MRFVAGSTAPLPSFQRKREIVPQVRVTTFVILERILSASG
jgi:hypothetical protein